MQEKNNVSPLLVEMNTDKMSQSKRNKSIMIMQLNTQIIPNGPMSASLPTAFDGTCGIWEMQICNIDSAMVGKTCYNRFHGNWCILCQFYAHAN